MHNSFQKNLLIIMELGGYPDFRPLYQQLGYDVTVMNNMRKVISTLKKQSFKTIVAEFNHRPDFRDRTSNLESLLAVVQKHEQTRVIVFYEKEHQILLDKLHHRFPSFQALAFPIDEKVLEMHLK